MIARGRYRGTFKATGTAIDAEFVHVFRFKDGKIVMWQSYTDTAQFKEAVGDAEHNTAWWRNPGRSNQKGATGNHKKLYAAEIKIKLK